MSEQEYQSPIERAIALTIKNLEEAGFGVNDEDVAQEREPITVRKIGYTMPVTTESLLWAGAITEEQAREMGWTPPPPTPRLRRWRRAVESWWYRHKPHVHLGPCPADDYDE